VLPVGGGIWLHTGSAGGGSMLMRILRHVLFSAIVAAVPAALHCPGAFTGPGLKPRASILVVPMALGVGGIAIQAALRLNVYYLILVLNIFSCGFRLQSQTITIRIV
jgi:hypothetical protein